MRLKDSFKRVGAIYQSSRRGYPKKLISELIKSSDLSEKSLILDIGCGTGKSTLPFASSGAKIIGVDISTKMIKESKKLLSNYPRASFMVSSFEKATLPKGSFDLIVSGTAFHWMKRKTAYKKIYNLLNNGGTFALFWGSGIEKPDRLLSALKKTFIKNAPDYPVDFGKLEKVFLPEIKKSKLFKNIKIRKYFITEKYSKAMFLRLVETYAWVIPMNKKSKATLFCELKKVLEDFRSPLLLHREYKLIIAKK